MGGDMDGKYEDAIRDYIDFVNQQVGVYTDATSGFAKNKSVVERQVHRVLRRAGVKPGKAGQPVVMMTSVEDTTQPEVIVHRIVLASEYLAANSEGGSNEQQHARAAIVFIFAYWDEEMRPRLAEARGVDIPSITSDVMGDIRHIRNAIIHNRGVLSSGAYGRIKVLRDLLYPDTGISLSNQAMHRIFALVKKDMAQMLLSHVGADKIPGFDASEVDMVAIERSSPKVST